MEPFFQQSWLFRGLPQSVMQNIYALGEVVEIRPGEVLISEGTFSGYLFFIIEGDLRVVLAEDLDRSLGLTVARRGPGDLLGEYSFFDRRLPAVTVVAEVPSRVFRMTHRSLRVFLIEDPESRATIYENMLVYLVGRLRDQDLELQVFGM